VASFHPSDRLYRAKGTAGGPSCIVKYGRSSLIVSLTLNYFNAVALLKKITRTERASDLQRLLWAQCGLKRDEVLSMGYSAYLGMLVGFRLFHSFMPLSGLCHVLWVQLRRFPVLCASLPLVLASANVCERKGWFCCLVARTNIEVHPFRKTLCCLNACV
jgi:hypothetical protein